ncbi:MAG: short-chain dehydrogenase [Alphaproteobacteria bacterium]|nr:MAG: short-chain dehydrogenase [Alphaproteobacteria bacterium]
MTATGEGGVWRGPALFSRGFRPFFLFGALYAGLIVALWVPWYLGLVLPPSAFPPTAWHVHELLFGYVPAIMAGFLLTVLPGWTGRPPLGGWPLILLLLLWLAGRAAVGLSSLLGMPATALACLAFPASLVAKAGRDIVAGRSWRNLKILLVVSAFFACQAAFEWEIWRFGRSLHAERLAIAAVLLLIMLIGGRIIPLFTGNWLKTRGASSLPAPFGRYDLAALAVGAAALVAWAIPDAFPPRGWLGALLLLAGLLHLGRQIRWQPHRTCAEPLVAILHVAYGFLPAGFVLAGCAVLLDSAPQAAAAIHAWTVGAIGTMTLAIMTRASLGQTGRVLKAGPFTIALYAAIVAATAARVAVALRPDWTMTLMPAAGLFWILAFLGFAAAYGPMLLTRRRDGVS